METTDKSTEVAKTSLLKVLLVEDDLVNQELFAEYLNILDTDVTVASCANSAISALEAEKSSGGFDLVLMDLHMPQKDGVQATIEWREIEDKEKLKPTTIYAITADVRIEERCRCMDSGMNGFLSKPFRLRDLKRLLDEVKSQ